MSRTPPDAPLLALEGVGVEVREPLGGLSWLRGRFFGPSRRILEGVDMEVRPGTVTAVLGANGAGKSTLLRVAAGLIEPGTGAVRRPVRAGYGVADERSFYWRLTARENLRFFARWYETGADEARIDALLARFGLADRADAPVRVYSAGMRARLGLARALLGSPRLLLLDEIERGLDAGARADLHAFLAEFDGAALVATHDLEHGAVFDDAVALDAGRIVAHGGFGEVAAVARAQMGSAA